MSKSPDGRLFVGEMAELGDSSNGRLLVFDGPDPQTGVFSKVTTYLSGVRNPNSLTFYTDKDGKTWLYLALTDRLERFAYAAGDLKPSSAPQVIATFPAYGESFTVGGWHLTRTVITHNDKLYVSVGSSCNSCEEKADEPQRATILEMEPDGSGQHIVANGLRNAVGIGFEGDDLYATANEVDHLGPDKPQDLLYKITPGTNYGWPYCYQSNGKIYLDTTKTWKTPYDCSKVPLAEFAFDPHTAPLGFDTFDGSFLVALHGSGNKGIGNGYDVVSVTKNASGTYTGKTFLTGFLDHGTVTGRIVDVLKNDASSIYLTDDFNGAIYLLKKK